MILTLRNPKSFPPENPLRKSVRVSLRRLPVSRSMGNRE